MGMRTVGYVVALLAVLSAPAAFAKDKSKPSGGAAAGMSSEPPEPLNACGCYKNGKGECVCTDKKGKCECPGECEPVGCAQKREKEMEREMAAEVKRAQEDEKKRKAAEEAAERGATPDAGASAAPEGAPDDGDKKVPKKTGPKASKK